MTITLTVSVLVWKFVSRIPCRFAFLSFLYFSGILLWGNVCVICMRWIKLVVYMTDTGRCVVSLARVSDLSCLLFFGACIEGELLRDKCVSFRLISSFHSLKFSHYSQFSLKFPRQNKNSWLGWRSISHVITNEVELRTSPLASFITNLFTRVSAQVCTWWNYFAVDYS